MNRIKEVLQQKSVTQTSLAEKLGKSVNMVNSYVQNRQQPRLEVLFEIAIEGGHDQQENKVRIFDFKVVRKLGGAQRIENSMGLTRKNPLRSRDNFRTIL